MVRNELDQVFEVLSDVRVGENYHNEEFSQVEEERHRSQKGVSLYKIEKMNLESTLVKKYLARKAVVRFLEDLDIIKKRFQTEK